MDLENQSAMDIRSLIDRADLILDDNQAEDFRSGGLIALAFCDLLTESLSGKQREGVEAARAFWSGTESELYQNSVAEFSEIISSDQRRSEPNERQVAIDRLVWSALNNNTEFSGYALEFLLWWGVNSGLSVQQMSNVLSKHIPGF